MTVGAGKGDQRRPARISREEEDLRWALATGLITPEQFDFRYQELLRGGKITRDGRVMHAGDQ